MHSRDLEDLTLLLVRDEEEPAMWLDRWLLSYPVAYMAKVSRHQRITDWQSILQTAFDAICSKNTAVCSSWRRSFRVFSLALFGGHEYPA